MMRCIYHKVGTTDNPTVFIVRDGHYGHLRVFHTCHDSVCEGHREGLLILIATVIYQSQSPNFLCLSYKIKSLNTTDSLLGTETDTLDKQ